MRTIRMRMLLCAATALTVMVGGCGDAPTDPQGSTEPVTLAVQVATADGIVDLIVVEVTGPGIPVPILTNLVMNDGTASGSITVPAGQSCTFTARGFDAEGGITHEGSVTEDVRPGQAIVRIPLVPRGVGVPIEVLASTYIISMDPVAAEMNIGEERQFTATVTDAEGQPIDVDDAMLTWASSNPVIASVDAAGLVSAGGVQGAARIAVSYEGIAAETDLVVTGDDLLSISLATSSSEVEPGEPFEVVATIRNRGDEPVTDIRTWLLVDDARAHSLPGASYVFPILDDGEQTGVAVLYELVDPLEPGDEVIWTATVYSHLVQGTTISPEARLESWQGPEDPYLGNNETTTSVAVTDGRIVFASDRNGPMNLFIANPDGTDLHQLTSHPAAEAYPAWSGDRSRIAFIRSGALWIINADGTGETQLDVPADNRPTWSPDGTRIAVSGKLPGSEHLAILVHDLESGSNSQLTEESAGSDFIHPNWSPDGKEIVLVRAVEENFLGDYLLRVELTNGTATEIYVDHGGACFSSGGRFPTWAPDGTAIAINGSALSDGDVLPSHRIYVLRSGPSAGGVSCGGGFSGRDLILDGSESETEYDWPAWSPNGNQLVVARRYSGEGSLFDLLTLRSDGTGPTLNITNWLSDDIQPHW
jgi:hypothetical protein